MTNKKGVRKALLKKLITGKKGSGSPSLKGASPFPMDSSLGKKVLNNSSGDIITGGNGSNLGTNGIF